MGFHVNLGECIGSIKGDTRSSDYGLPVDVKGVGCRCSPDTERRTRWQSHRALQK